MLNKSQMMEVCSYLAQIHSINETKEFIKEKFEIDAPVDWIKRTFFRKNSQWRKMIDSFKNTFLHDIESVPGAHKKVRLKRYDELYKEAIKQKKVQYAKSILDSMREEIEGGDKKFTIGSAIIAQINQMPDDELIREKDRLLERLDKLKRLMPQSQGGENAV